MPKKDFDPNPVIPVSHFSGNYPSWWGVNEQQVPQAFPKKLGSKDDSPPSIHHEAKSLGLTLADQDSSSTQSMGLSQHEASVVGGVDSQDHSISSESGTWTCLLHVLISSESFASNGRGVSCTQLGFIME